MEPPGTARPWVFWFWMDGNISREGLTTDLEAMARVGIGGAIIMDITHDIPKGPVTLLSPEWKALFRHATEEAARLGLEIGMHNAPGWCGSGGPWIPPELAMQKLVFSQTNVTGPAEFVGALPPPSRSGEHVARIGAIAFPTIVGDGAQVPGASPRFSTRSGEVEPGILSDRKPKTFVRLPPPRWFRSSYLQASFERPYTADYLSLAGTARTPSFSGVLQVSEDGRSFRDIREFTSAGPELELQFPQVQARHFRVLIKSSEAGSPLEIERFELSPRFRVDAYLAKSGLGRYALKERPQEVPAYAVIPTNQVVDLAQFITAEGLLRWEVPQGNWTILNFGSMPTGRKNPPARAEGFGLEVDKLSTEALEHHFQAYLGELIEAAGPLGRRAFSLAHIDSWEVRYQNWTPEFRGEFQQRRGYDPLPWLPTATGRFVATPALTERFLWDMRRTIADLQAENYAGHLAKLTHRHGLKLSAEAYGNGPFDSLLYASRVDLPMSEFWVEPDGVAHAYYSKAMSSAAHVYGKKLVAAEAFTAMAVTSKWRNHPFALKPLADEMFCAGVNQFVFHRYAHQPWLDRRPGMTMAHWGIQYERTQTWWEQSTAWHRYIARCQQLLRSGLHVADVCYLTPEGAYSEPPPIAQLEPALPPGYHYDVAPPQAVFERMSSRPGEIILPDGMSYRVLVLPPSDTMTPELLKKVRSLVQAGAVVYGPAPSRSPSLMGYPRCDEEVRKVAAELWGEPGNDKVIDRTVGRGRVVWGKPLEALFQELKLRPDFGVVADVPGYPLRYTHRRIGGTDAYFLANSNAHPVAVTARFRVAGQQPELWHPDTGLIETNAVWREDEGITEVPLRLGPAGSAFVVFRYPRGDRDAVVSLTRDGSPAVQDVHLTFSGGGLRAESHQPGNYTAQMASGKSLDFVLPPVPESPAIQGPWQLQFPPGLGAPRDVKLEKLISWSEHADFGVRHFSGTATYTRAFHLSQDFFAEGVLLELDLGKVQVIAQPRLNGKPLGTLWKPPFAVDITSVARPGENRLEIDVVNLWPNRLIGDEHLPEDATWKSAVTQNGTGLVEWPQWLLEGKPSPTGRVGFASWKFYTKDMPLLESGLLGPVTIRTKSEVRIPR